MTELLANCNSTDRTPLSETIGSRIDTTLKTAYDKYMQAHELLREAQLSAASTARGNEKDPKNTASDVEV